MSGYSDFITAIVQLTGGYNLVSANSATPTDDSDFNAILSSTIQSAEAMIYRDPDLDFLGTRALDQTQTTTANSRLVTIPSQYLTIEQVTLTTPVSTAPSLGTRVPLSRVSPEYINAVYPIASYSATPVYGESVYAMFDSSRIIIGPTPNGSYNVEYWGVVQQTPLSATNTSTVITNFYPDLMVAAAMVYLSGFMKDFSSNGGAPDNASQGVNWKTYYDSLKTGAAFYSARQRFLGAGATAYPPAPQAATQR